MGKKQTEQAKPPQKPAVEGPYRLLAVRTIVEIAVFKEHKLEGRINRVVDLMEVEIPDEMEAVLRKKIDSGKSGPLEPSRG